MWKKMLGVMLGLLILGVALASAAPLYTKWPQVKHVDLSGYTIYNSAVLQYSGYFSGYEDGKPKAIYTFKIASEGVAKNVFGEWPAIHKMGVYVEKIAGNDNFYILSSQTDKKVLGAWPHPGIDYYFGDVALDLFETVVSYLLPEAGIAIAAGTIVKDLKQGVDEFLSGDETMDGHLSAEWDLGPAGTSKCGHYLKFWIDAEVGNLIEFSAKDKVYGAYNTNEGTEITWNVMIDVLPTPSDPEVLSTTLSDKIYNTMSRLYYKIRYDSEIVKFRVTYNGKSITFYKIQPDVIDKYAEKFGLPLSIAEKFKKSGKPVYYTPDSIGITVVSAEG